MTTSVADIRARFPEFADDTEYPDARIDIFIQDASDIHMGTDEARWCGKYNVAQAYLTAHLLSLATGSEAGDTSARAGVVTGKTAGGVSVTRSTVAKDRSTADDFYMSTTYGQQFIIIRNMCFAGVLVANTL
mgnify:CR=1 FL=1